MKSELKLEGDDGSTMTIEQKHEGAMLITIEVPDPQGFQGQVIRTSFMPSKSDAIRIAGMLLGWSDRDH